MHMQAATISCYEEKKVHSAATPMKNNFRGLTRVESQLQKAEEEINKMEMFIISPTFYI